MNDCRHFNLIPTDCEHGVVIPLEIERAEDQTRRVRMVGEMPPCALCTKNAGALPIGIDEPLGVQRGGSWLILGSSRSMPRFAGYAWTRATVIATCNAGIYECLLRGRWPDFYGVMDPASPELYGHIFDRMKEGGTKVVTSTLARDYTRLGEIGHDVMLEVAKGIYPETEWSPGRYVAGGPTGCFLTQLAVNSGAEEIHLVGMEGYDSTPSRQVVETFDGKVGGPVDQKVTRRIYGPLMQTMADQCRGTEFYAYGQLRYSFVGPNVHRISEIPEASIDVFPRSSQSHEQ